MTASFVGVKNLRLHKLRSLLTALVTLTWFKHQGPGTVKFTPPTARVPVTGGSASTAATFSEPGDYIVRVRANDASGLAGAGHAQCCWTNGFVKITVNR